MFYARLGAAARASRLEASFTPGTNSASRFGLAAIAFALVAAFTPLAASANTYTWTGASSVGWSDTGNWNTNVVPGAADDARFNVPTYPYMPTLDAAGDSLGMFENSGTTSITITPNVGSILTLNGVGSTPIGLQIDSNAGGITMNAGVVLGAAQTWTDNSIYNPVVVNGGIATGGFQLTLNNSGSDAGFIVNGGIAGTGGLTRSGNVLLFLNAANSFSGPTNNTSTNGGIVLGNSNALQQSNVTTGGGALSFGTLTSAAFGGLTAASNNVPLLLNNTLGAPVALTIDGGQNTTFASNIGGLGTITLTGSSALTLSGTSSNIAGFILSQGTLQLNTPLLGLYSPFTVNPAGALTFNSFIGAAALGSLSGAGSVALTDISSNSVALVVGGNSLSTTYSGVLGGGGSLNKVGTSTLTLTGANSYQGGTNVFGGTLELNYANTPTVLNSTSPVGLDGGTLLLTGKGSGATSQMLGGLAVGAGQSAIVLNSHGGTGVALNVGSLTYSTQGGALNISPDASSSVTTSTAPDSTGIYGGRVVYKGANWATSSGGIIGAYTGYQTLNGSTDVSGSNYQVASDTTLTAAETINSLKIANPAAGQSLDLNSNILNINNGGLLFTGANGFNITDSIGFGAITGGNDPLGNGGPAYDLIIHQYNSGGGTISAAIADNNFNPTALTHAGTGTTYMAGNNSYSGPTFLSGGTLSLQSTGALGNSPTVTFAGGVLQYSAVNTVDISGKIAGSSGPIAIDTGGQLVTFASALANSNSGGLLKLGQGTLSLSASNSYAGPTIVANGAINATFPAALSTGPVTVASGGTLNLNCSANENIYNAFSGNGTINATAIGNISINFIGSPNGPTGAGSFGSGNFNGVLNFNGAGSPSIQYTTLSGGTINIANGTTLYVNIADVASAFTIAGSGTGMGALRVDYNSGFPAVVSGNVTLVGTAAVGSAGGGLGIISGNISGPYELIRINNNSGTYLSGSNSFASLQISGGNIVLGSSNALNPANPMPVTFAPFTGNITTGVTRTLSLNGYSVTVSSLSSANFLGAGQGQCAIRNQDNYASASGVENNVPAMLTVSNTGTTSYFGSIVNGTQTSAAPLSLTKTNTGTLVLAGTGVSYTGQTSINGGTLAVDNTSGMSGTSPIVFGGGSLQYAIAGVTTDFSSKINNSTAAISIDTGVQTVNYGSAIGASNTAGLTKLGAGLLSLGTSAASVANGYTGLTSVSAGSLAVFGSLASTGSVNVAPAATFMLGGAGAGSVGATVVQGGAAIDFSKITASGSYAFSSLALAASSSLNTPNTLSLAPFATATALSLTGSNSITINFPTGTAITSGTYGLLGYGGGVIGGDGNGIGDLKIGANDIIGSSKFVNTGSFIDLVVTAPITTWTWNGTGTDWVSANAWTASGGTTTETFQSGDVELLKDTAGTGSAVSNGFISLNTSNVTPGSVTFSNTAVPYVISGGFGIAGPTTVTVNGAGSVSLTTSNGYTGGTTLVSGLLNLDNASAIGSGILTINGGTLGNDSGSSVALTTSNPQVWQASSFAYQGPNSLNLGNGAVTMTGSTTIFVSSGSLEVDGGISGPGSLTQNGAGTLILGGSNAYLGATIVKGGTLQIGSGGASGTFGAGAVTDNGAIVFSRSDSGLVVANNISGSGSVTQNGPGLLTLTGSNTYASGTFVSAGSLQVSSTFSLSNYTAPGAGSVSNGAGLILGVGGSNQFQPADVASVLSNISFTGNSNLGLDTTAAPGPVTLSANISAPSALSVVKLGPGTLIVTGNNTYGGPLTVAGGVLQLGTSNTVAAETVTVLAANGLGFSPGIGSLSIGGLSGDGGFSLQDTSSAPVFLAVGANNANTTFSGALTGSGSLDKTGAGVLTLTASNGYQGGTTVNSGTLAITNASALGAGMTTINPAGTVNVVGINQINAGFAGSGTINSEPNNGQETDFRGLAGFTGVLNAISGGGSSKTDVRDTVMSGGTINIASGTTVFFQSDVIAASIFVSGTGNSEKLGALRIDGDTVSGGTISSVVLNGPVTLLGNTTLGNQGGASTSSTIAAPIGDNGGGFGFTLEGNGTIILASSNTYTGGTTIASGMLQLGQSNAVALTTVTVNAANGLAFSPGIGVFNAGGLAGSASFALLDTSANPVTLSAGGNGQSTAYSGNLGGGGSLVKTGTGTLTLNGVSNTYAGGTQVVAGVLQLGNASALGTGGLAADGGTLDMAGYSVTVPSFSGATGVVTDSLVASLGTLTVDQPIATTFGGSITDGQGQTSLMLMGGGTLTLSGTNTYTGGTSVAADGSMLIVTNPEALADGSSLTVGNAFYFSPLAAAGAAAGQAGGVSPVPEPGTLALLAAAGGIALLRLRRQLRRPNPALKGPAADEPTGIV